MWARLNINYKNAIRTRNKDYPMAVHYASLHDSNLSTLRIIYLEVVTGSLFHCTVRRSTVQYGSLLGGFPLGTVPGTWYFFSTTSAEVPSDRYRYQNVTCKLYLSLIGRRKSSVLRHWTCDTRPSSTARPARFKSAQPAKDRTQLCLNIAFLHQAQNSRFVICWENTDVPLVDSRGADPATAWWGDAEWKSLMYIFRVCFLFIFLPLYLCFASIKNNLIE